MPGEFTMRLLLDGGKTVEFHGPADITKETTEAIVNAANSSLLGGGGVDGAIHRAGGPSILAECKKIVRQIQRLPPGKAVITTGGRLEAKYVVHTVGPVYSRGNRHQKITRHPAMPARGQCEATGKLPAETLTDVLSGRSAGSADAQHQPSGGPGARRGMWPR